jgi:transcriptional regulator with XRE-family HTH domain
MMSFDYLGLSDMAASLAAPINHDLLVWARKTAGYSVEAAAGKLGLKPEKLDAIERGDRPPSFAQIKKAADVYRRPLAVFFLRRRRKRKRQRMISACNRASHNALTHRA